MAEAKKEVKKTEVEKESTKEEEQTAVKKTSTAVAKAGKRSKKAVIEEAQKEAKEERKQAAPEPTKKAEVKPPQPKHTPKNMEKAHGKKYREVQKLVEPGKLYTLTEAVELVQKLSKVKFDATMELHINLGIDPKQSDQTVRTSAVLPAGTGKSVKIAVIADDKDAATAKAAGADETDSEKLLAQIEKGKFDFDVLIATAAMMPALAKHAKVLGPKGLMPSPKAGTVTTEVETTVKELKAGRAELKNDSAGIIHAAFGKVSFKSSDLVDNAKVAILAVTKARPASTKGTYVKSIAISASMSPSVKLDITQTLKDIKN